MAEGGREKFPDHWNLEFFWIVIVEYLSHSSPFLFFTFYFLRIFLSDESRKLILESELSTNPNPSDSCGCAPSDGSFPKASNPTCEFVRRQEVFKFLW